MRDIVISGKRIRCELLVLLGCIVAAELVNAFAIVRFDRPWTELVSMAGYVLLVAVVIYILLALVRALACLARFVASRF